jgi:hypothetical protein
MQLDFQRYECKYVVPAAMAAPIRAFIQPYAEPDRYSRYCPSEGYGISSLYLDSPDLTFHQAKDRVDLDRLKLRIRYYDDQIDGPVFFEIKRRTKDVVRKRRVRVATPGWGALMSEPGALLRTVAAGRDRDALAEFLDLGTRYAAGPVVVVRYRREAYQGTIDDYARVTFDRRIEYRRANGYVLPGEGRGWEAIDDASALGTGDHGMVLELKFADHAPVWMADLVQRFGLRRRGFSKYSTSVERTLSGARSSHDVPVPTGRAVS